MRVIIWHTFEYKYKGQRQYFGSRKIALRRDLSFGQHAHHAFYLHISVEGFYFKFLCALYIGSLLKDLPSLYRISVSVLCINSFSTSANSALHLPTHFNREKCVVLLSGDSTKSG